MYTVDLPNTENQYAPKNVLCLVRCPLSKRTIIHIYEIGTCAHVLIRKMLTPDSLFGEQKAYQLSSSPATIDIPSSLTLIADMGLGKTLQSLCIMAGDHHHRVRELEVNGSTTAPPSLVVCPPTLTGHWCYEVRKFCDPEDLNPLQYAGPPNTRARLVNIHSQLCIGKCVCKHVSILQVCTDFRVALFPGLPHFYLPVAFITGTEDCVFL